MVSSDEVRGCLYHASLLVASHLESESDVGNGIGTPRSNRYPQSRLLNCRGREPVTTEEHEPQRSNGGVYLPHKRRRISESYHDRTAVRRLGGIENALPSKSVIDLVIVQYFATIHHWIPMLHEGRFRARLQDINELVHLTTLLHALTAITLRHIDLEQTDLDLDAVDEQIQTSTDIVKLHALENISVENCQALIMLCWDRMGCGDWSKAWSILGSLTRTVDYLQMTVEPDASQAHPLLAPVTLLNASKSHAEAEERKRVFWHIFLLDRLCAMCCGWSTTFSSDNVSRQLPCNGGIWRRGEDATTPYFLMWEKSQAKMGHSVAYLPTYQTTTNSRTVNNNSPGVPQGVDISNLGAVAYRIESTESLSRVSSFFLQQHVNFEDKREISDWLTRFKELDLRLVQ